MRSVSVPVKLYISRPVDVRTVYTVYQYTVDGGTEVIRMCERWLRGGCAYAGVPVWGCRGCAVCGRGSACLGVGG